jgi:hypothetical protein
LLKDAMRSTRALGATGRAALPLLRAPQSHPIVWRLFCGDMRLIRANAGSAAQIFENLPFDAWPQHACQEDGVSVAGMSRQVSTVHLSTGRPLRPAGFLFQMSE